MLINKLLLSATLFLGILPAMAQQTISVDLKSAYRQKKLQVVNRHADVTQEGLHVDEQPGAGIVWLTGIQFTNGELTFDVKGRDVLQKSFVGIAFHGRNDSTYEAVYLRPFNFRSADATRKSHSLQYISMPDNDWEKLREAFPGKYERALEPAPHPDEWVHVRIVVKDKQIAVYIGQQPKAILEVTSLSRQAGGKLGLWTGNNSTGDWRNLQIRPAP